MRGKKMLRIRGEIIFQLKLRGFRQRLEGYLKKLVGSESYKQMNLSPHAGA